MTKPGVQKPHCEPWVDHRLLHGMQAALADMEIVDGDHFLAVDLAQEQDAGIDRLIDHAAVAQRAQRHRAGAAIALAAAFLGAAGAFLQPQIVEQRRHRRYVGEFDHLAPAQETDGASDRHQLPR